MDIEKALSVRLDAERIYPIPEILPDDEGRGWKVQHDADAAWVDYEKRTIVAPLDESDLSRCIKLQQIARIKWDDRSLDCQKWADSLLFRAVEDNRISFLLQRAGIDIRPGFFTAEVMDRLNTLNSQTGALCVMLMADYTSMAPNPAFISNAKNDKLVRAYQEVRRRIAADPTKKNSLAVVSWLMTLFKDQTIPQWMKGSSKSKGMLLKGSPTNYTNSLDFDFDDCYEMAWDDLDDDTRLQEIPPEVRAQLPKDISEYAKTMIRGFLDQFHPGYNPFGSMTVDEPPRTISATGKFHKKWKATDEGVLPRYPHRYAVDQRIFARRHKLPGGTVLIDSSGSMGLTVEAIKLMVEHAPGCMVANYSGTGTMGVLRILAKGGMRVADELCMAPYGTGNIIDYPALKWAYRQSHPRVWVSDMGCTGLNDGATVGNVAMALAAARKGRFFVAQNCDEAVAILKRLGRFYRKL